MSSQDQSASASASFKLNPSATEFVPGNFNLAGSSTITSPSAVASTDSGSKSNNYNNSGYQNQRYNSNSYNQHGGGQNNRYNNNNGRNNHHNHNNYYHQNQFNGNAELSEYDPIEIEARCEAVVEILQDDKIRDQLNHISNSQSQQSGQPENQNNSNNMNRNNNSSRQNIRNQNGHSNYEEEEPQFDDEEEMLEMLEMQEECRLEMMKFYIQSQNPSLFEEIYHDVSYPDANKRTSPQRGPAHSRNGAVESNKNEPVASNPAAPAPAPAASAAATADKSADEIKDLIVNNLNPDVDDFVPNKLADLSLTDEQK